MTGKPVEKTVQDTTSRRKRAQSRPPEGPARFSDLATTTRANAIYLEMHRAIASMELLPGTAISENVISERMGVSRTPVREAVLRLTKEKLVEVVPQSGTFVARIPLSALTEALVVRRALEAVTVRAGVVQATPSQIMGFHTLIQQQRDIAETGDMESFHRADEEFHAEFAKVGKYPGVWDLIRQVKIQVDRYRRLTLPLAGRMEMIVQEHEAVVDALSVGDATLAVERMEQHLDHLRLDVCIVRDTWPDYFIHDITVD
ncbi:MAG: DNA-binding GntR family transcriptional regulator [Paracoccaceae bacterium]|jgi:DNA-binding GntR family transcriptional regulator